MDVFKYSRTFREDVLRKEYGFLLYYRHIGCTHSFLQDFSNCARTPVRTKNTEKCVWNLIDTLYQKFTFIDEYEFFTLMEESLTTVKWEETR